MALPKQSRVEPVLLEVLLRLEGRALPADVYPRVTERFPELTPDDLARKLKDGRTSLWINRIQWARQNLADAGLIDKSKRGVWELTTAGLKLAQKRPSSLSLKEWNDVIKEARKTAGIAAPERDRAISPPLPGVREKDDPDVARRVLRDDAPIGESPKVFPLIQPDPQSIESELREAARDSKNPGRLEAAVADAFSFLGFTAERVGGSGETDVLLTAPLGKQHYKVVVDAKSTSQARVADSQIKWHAIDHHREKSGARYACIVGAGFAGGYLEQEAKRNNVTLLTIDELIEIIKCHNETPLTLTELEAIFRTIPRATAALPELWESARRRHRRQLLIAKILERINWLNRVRPDIIVNGPNTLLLPILQNEELSDITAPEVQEALDLLEKIGIIRFAGDQGYVLETSLAGARQFLAALARLPVEDAEKRA